jgi:hypothetical protein
MHVNPVHQALWLFVLFRALSGGSFAILLINTGILSMQIFGAAKFGTACRLQTHFIWISYSSGTIAWVSQRLLV